MSNARATVAAAFAVTALSAVTMVAWQQPRIGNAQVTEQPAGSLQQTFRAAVAAQRDTGWIAYGAPVVDGDRVMCCFNSGTHMSGNVVFSDTASCCGMCRLEPTVRTSEATTTPQGQPMKQEPIKLEGADEMLVLFRIVNQEVERVRTFSDGCALDAGGRPVVWLTGVRPPDSVALLESLVTARKDLRDRVLDGAIAAIALHRDASADASLERLLASANPTSLRAKVPFWLGHARGRRGLDVLQRLIKEDSSGEVKKKAVFGISQSGEPQSTEILLDAARTSSEPGVRSESLFWLAQKAGSKAAAAITERVEQDPDTEVKKRAVFALSQLPKNEGVPMLIRVARTHTNPAVKKQAIFWLGQSKDPRALEFFAEILK